MWSFLRAQWLPYAAIGAIAVVAGAFGAGYLKGSQSKDQAWQLKWERQRSAIMEANAERTNQALQAMADRHRAQARVARQIREIPIPDTDACTHPEWLHAHDRAVRAANGAG